MFPAQKARQLRKKMTDAERRLWSVLRGRTLSGYKFRRQHPIGLYIADFACVEHRLVIEADGGQHADNLDDERRTVWLESQGWRVMRFWNNDILTNTDGVVRMIVEALEVGRCGQIPCTLTLPSQAMGPSLSRFTVEGLNPGRAFWRRAAGNAIGPRS
jgi:very-short-patch-repair endonuclease